MNRKHAFTVSLLLALAAVVGAVAAFRTAGVGRSAQAAPVAASTIAQRNHRLDQVEASLRRALAKKPPKVKAAARKAEKVVYVRPAPVVHVVPRSGGHEDEGEGGHEGGDD